MPQATDTQVAETIQQLVLNHQISVTSNPRSDQHFKLQLGPAGEEEHLHYARQLLGQILEEPIPYQQNASGTGYFYLPEEYRESLNTMRDAGLYWEMRTLLLNGDISVSRYAQSETHFSLNGYDVNKVDTAKKTLLQHEIHCQNSVIGSGYKPIHGIDFHVKEARHPLLHTLFSRYVDYMQGMGDRLTQLATEFEEQGIRVLQKHDGALYLCADEQAQGWLQARLDEPVLGDILRIRQRGDDTLLSLQTPRNIAKVYKRQTERAVDEFLTHLADGATQVQKGQPVNC